MSLDSAVLFLTHAWGPAHALRFHRLRRETAGVATCHVLFQSTGDDAFDRQPVDDARAVHVFRAADLPGRLGYDYLTPQGVVPGCAHFPIIDFAADHLYKLYWVIEGDVEFTGNWADLLRAASATEAGLLATHVRRYRDDPDWTWWSSLRIPGAVDRIIRNRPGKRLRAFMPVYRISCAALRLVDRLHRLGWTGHQEVVLPTAIGNAGLGVADLNSLGCFYRGSEQAPDGDAEARSSMRWRPEVSSVEFVRQFSANTLFHPVKGQWTFDGSKIVMLRGDCDAAPDVNVSEPMRQAERVSMGDGPEWVATDRSECAPLRKVLEHSRCLQMEQRSFHQEGPLIGRRAGEARMTTVSNPITFCISLKDSPRRGTFAALASRHSVAFEFVDALSADDIRRGATVGDCRIDITDLRWTHFDRLDTRRVDAPLMYSEIGCAYSHMMCWRLAKEANLDHVCIIEDDAVLCRSLQSIDIPSDVDMVYLGNRMPRDHLGNAKPPGRGTEGYILTRTGILKCLEIFSILYMPVDLQLMAHQVSSIESGFWLANHRRHLPDASLLKAYVARRPHCYHPDDDNSQIDPVDIRNAVAERDILRRRLAAMRNSTSWRVTAPIRALKTMFMM